MDNFANKVRIISQDEESYTQLLIKAGLPDLEITTNNDEANILLAAPPMVADNLDQFPKLEWMQSTFAGVDALTRPGLPTNYELTNVKGIFGQQIAEYVLGYTIQHTRHFKAYAQDQLAQRWQPLPYQTLAGKQLLILGTGTIGNHLAKVACALGLHTVGVNRTGIPPKESAFSQVSHIEQIEHHLPNTDIIVSTLPKTPQTSAIFNGNFFSLCRQTLFFNLGRGDAVVTEDLLKALEQNQIAHAFLDVFINEPISKQSPYWQNPKVTITPHIAAFSFPEQVVEIFCQNYKRWLSGFALMHQIDFDKGY